MKNRRLLVYPTDHVRDDAPEESLEILAPGHLVIFRDYGHPNRRALGQRLRQLARRKRLIFLVAGDARLAHRLRADGLHLNRHMLMRKPVIQPHPRWLYSAAAHDRRELALANRQKPNFTLISPVFRSASHPGAEKLGPHRFQALSTRSLAPVIALGGISKERHRRLHSRRPFGLAAIGGLKSLVRSL